MADNTPETSFFGRDRRFILVLLVLLYVIVLVQTAWMGDDAFITTRSVENLVHGYGPNVNVGERVQTFTHPLWMLLLSFPYYLLVGVLQIQVYGLYYYLAILYSLVFSAAAVAVFAFKIARSTLAAILGVATLALSQAFVDYSTSGLENPLTHLLLVAFVWVFFSGRPADHRRLFWLALIAALGVLNRMDTLLLFAPPLIYQFFITPLFKRKLAALALAFTPFFIWELFSLFYYGFLTPNTAFAKLSTGISSARLVQQGLYYFMNSLDVDPLTLFVIAGVLLLAVLSRQDYLLLFSSGVALYLLYVLKIGGDFMGGRFFAAPLLVAVCLLGRYRFDSLKTHALILALVVALGFSSPAPTLLSHSDYGLQYEDPQDWINLQGIADERAYYYRETGLLTGSRETIFPDSRFSGPRWVYHPQEVRVEVIGPAGMVGYHAGPNRHIVDRNALLDPLLARLPVDNKLTWRIGHFHRTIPEGYLETLESGQNQIQNENLAAYYDKLALITRGSLFSRERLLAIWEINTGRYDYLVKEYLSSLGQ